MHNSIAILNLLPVGIVLLVALTAGATSYLTYRRTMPGRTRSSSAYQLGFLAGLAAALGLANLPPAFALENVPIAEAGILASFVSPFAGLVHGELRRLAQQEEMAPTSGVPTGNGASNFRPFQRFLDSVATKPRAIHLDR
jgi:hypothetical protein